MALLPDLDPAAPSDVAVSFVAETGKSRFLLGFASAVANVGDGPLIIVGHRESTDQPTMTADQLAKRPGAGAPGTIRAGVGILRYHLDETHSHFHLVRFMRFELRRAATFALVHPDRKSGFCLGDRYEVEDIDLPAKPAAPVYRFSDCGRNKPDALSVTEGISVGYGDHYEPWREGQYIDITGVPAGRYLLVHRVNPKRRLVEMSYANNASSVLIRLTWPDGSNGSPRLRVLATCEASARCPAG